MTTDKQFEIARAAEAGRECAKAEQHTREGRWEEAVAAVPPAIEADPNCLDAYQVRASLRTSECNWSGFFNGLLTEVTRLDPKRRDTYANRAFANVQMGG